MRKAFRFSVWILIAIVAIARFMPEPPDDIPDRAILTGHPEFPALDVRVQILHGSRFQAGPFEWLVDEEYIEEWEAGQMAEAEE